MNAERNLLQSPKNNYAKRLKKSIVKSAGAVLSHQRNLSSGGNEKQQQPIRSSFDEDLKRRLFLARNNLLLNALISAILIFAQVFPLMLPWYAYPNYEALPDGGYIEVKTIAILKKRSEINLVVSLLSVYTNGHWLPIRTFIDTECPFTMRSGFECLKMNNFQYAAIGYLALKIASIAFQINNILAIINSSINREHCNRKVSPIDHKLYFSEGKLEHYSKQRHYFSGYYVRAALGI